MAQVLWSGFGLRFEGFRAWRSTDLHFSNLWFRALGLGLNLLFALEARKELGLYGLRDGCRCLALASGPRTYQQPTHSLLLNTSNPDI